MNVARVLPMAATGVPKFSSLVMSSWLRAGWIFVMFWQ